VLYAPVSAHDQGADLDQQVARPAAWATDQGVAVAEVVCGVGSAMNASGRSSGGCSPTGKCA